jgi:hypothetical protein
MSLPASQPELIERIAQHLDPHIVIAALQHAVANPAAPELVPKYRAALKALAARTQLFELRRSLADDEEERENVDIAEEDAGDDLVDEAKACKPLLDEFFNQSDVGTLDPKLALKELDDRARHNKFTLAALKALCKANAKHVVALGAYARSLFSKGRYKEAADLLDVQRRLFVPRYRRRADDDEEEQLADDAWAPVDPANAWGRWVCAALLGNRDAMRDAAAEVGTRLDAIRDGSVVAPHLWFVHLHLPMLRAGPQTNDLLWKLVRDARMESSLRYRYQNLVQCNAPHVLPYLAAAAVLNKMNGPMLLRVARLCEGDQHRLNDPITGFLLALKSTCAFDKASALIEPAAALMRQDYFLAPHADKFAENARLLICDSTMRVHRVLSTEKVGEAQLVQLIREANVDATIDSVNKMVYVHTSYHKSIWRQVLDTLAVVPV